MAPALAVIAAVASNGVIGAGNRLPWRIADDLRRFRALTTGHAVIMVPKTWESLPHALPGRQNIVVTRQQGYAAPGADIAGGTSQRGRDWAFNAVTQTPILVQARAPESVCIDFLHLRR